MTEDIYFRLIFHANRGNGYQMATKQCIEEIKDIEKTPVNTRFTGV